MTASAERQQPRPLGYQLTRQNYTTCEKPGILMSTARKSVFTGYEFWGECLCFCACVFVSVCLHTHSPTHTHTHTHTQPHTHTHRPETQSRKNVFTGCEKQNYGVTIMLLIIWATSELHVCSRVRSLSGAPPDGVTPHLLLARA